MNISIFGLGYVGGAMRAVLEKGHRVFAYDVNPAKSPNCHSPQEAIAASDVFLLCLPTDYSKASGGFDTSALDQTIDLICALKPRATLIVKSTVPLSYCDALQERHPKAKVFFSPEFLKESSAIEDALRPSRLVIGCRKEHQSEAKKLGKALLQCLENHPPVLFLSLQEAEAVKLFSNAYLAMRIAFFNELDTYAMEQGLNAKAIIEGVGLDPRIGLHYCNPSFGFGGYCLPKDTEQLKANYRPLPEHLISAVLESNATRKRIVAKEILQRLKEDGSSRVLIYRLRMEEGSSSYRYSCMEDLIPLLKSRAEVYVYEPCCLEETFLGCPLIRDEKTALAQSDLIVANRKTEALEPFASKLFTRDARYSS